MPNSASKDWKTNRPESRWRSLPPLHAIEGETALAGQALKLNGEPLPKVTIKIDDFTALTDDTGRFLLSGISEGWHEMLIDGPLRIKVEKSTVFLKWLQKSFPAKLMSYHIRFGWLGFIQKMQ